jgi:plastocyanin
MRTSAPLRFAVLALAGAAAASCGGSSGPTSNNTPAIAKTATASGDGQAAQVGTALAAALRVVVTVNGTPQAGETVTWAAIGTGASVNPTQASTDANGVASTTWTLGTTAGTQTATASLAGATGSPVTFTATATAAPVPVIAMTGTASGNGQTDSVTGTLPESLRVFVTLMGTAQAGDTVAWAALGTGAAVSPAKSVTNASGIATTSWTLGHTAGAQSATATLAGATGSPVTFGAVATAGAATQVGLLAGNNQTGVVGGKLSNALQVLVGDRFQNGVAGVAVTWQVTGGSATADSTSTTSNATGVAQTTLTLGNTAGPATITATSTGLLGSPVTFDETVAASAGVDTVQFGNFFFKSVRNGTQNPAVDTVLAGGKIVWIWVSGSHGVQSLGSPSFTSSTVLSSGSYSFTFSTAGTYQYDCLVHGTLMTGTIVVR